MPYTVHTTHPGAISKGEEGRRRKRRKRRKRREKEPIPRTNIRQQHFPEVADFTNIGLYVSFFLLQHSPEVAELARGGTPYWPDVVYSKQCANATGQVGTVADFLIKP